MKTLSLDLRKRILSAYDAGDAMREMIAGRIRVSLDMVKKPGWQHDTMLWRLATKHRG